MMLRSLALGVLVAACHHASVERADAPAEPVVGDSTRPSIPTVERAPGALSAAERDSIVREVQARRAAWRARGITNYSIRVAVGCFCPWPGNPAILEVRGGVAQALRDTTGCPMGPLREPWSAYTVEALFDFVEQAARTHDVVSVTYDASFGYPTSLRGDAKLGQVDDWYWVRASQLTPSRGPPQH
jgi:hypothetical protein